MMHDANRGKRGRRKGKRKESKLGYNGRDFRSKIEP
jgi:hypothetical protein